MALKRQRIRARPVLPTDKAEVTPDVAQCDLHLVLPYLAERDNRSPNAGEDAYHDVITLLGQPLVEDSRNAQTDAVYLELCIGHNVVHKVGTDSIHWFPNKGNVTAWLGNMPIEAELTMSKYPTQAVTL